MGAFETGALASVEATLKYHPNDFDVLTDAHYLGAGHCLVGSLSGADSSQRVTEECEGLLRLIGNQPLSARA